MSSLRRTSSLTQQLNSSLHSQKVAAASLLSSKATRLHKLPGQLHMCHIVSSSRKYRQASDAFACCTQPTNEGRDVRSNVELGLAIQGATNSLRGLFQDCSALLCTLPASLLHPQHRKPPSKPAGAVVLPTRSGKHCSICARATGSNGD